MQRLVIYGAGGFGREVLRSANHFIATNRGYDEIVFATDNLAEVGKSFGGCEVISAADIHSDDGCVIAVNEPDVRRRIAQRSPHLNFVTLHAPFAVVYPGVIIGGGAIISDFTSVTTDERTVIGNHFHINTHSTVGHDCTIGDFVTVGPNVSVNGNVIIEDDVYIGCGARIRNGTPEHPLRIGRGAVVGMGAVVVRDVPPNVTMIGNPARPLVRDVAA